MRKTIALGNGRTGSLPRACAEFHDNNVEHVLTHYSKILRAGGRGEGRCVCRNFAAECTREAEVDFAERYLALVRVVRLKHTFA